MLVYVCAAFFLVDLRLYFVEISNCKNRFKQQTYCTSSFVVLLPRILIKRLVYTGICTEMKSSKSCDKRSRPFLSARLLIGSNILYSDLHME